MRAMLAPETARDFHAYFIALVAKPQHTRAFRHRRDHSSRQEGGQDRGLPLLGRISRGRSVGSGGYQ